MLNPIPKLSLLLLADFHNQNLNPQTLIHWHIHLTYLQPRTFSERVLTWNPLCVRLPQEFSVLLSFDITELVHESYPNGKDRCKYTFEQCDRVGQISINSLITYTLGSSWLKTIHITECTVDLCMNWVSYLAIRYSVMSRKWKVCRYQSG